MLLYYVRCSILTSVKLSIFQVGFWVLQELVDHDSGGTLCDNLLLNEDSVNEVMPFAFLVAQRIKHLPAMQETRVRSLGWEDPLEKEMATYSSILAWRIPWTEEPGGLQSTGPQRVGHN